MAVLGGRMRSAAWLSFIVLMAGLLSAPVHAQTPDDDLRIYSVSFNNSVSFIWPFSGYGVYLGRGTILTAAHVAGRWSILASPRIVIAGQELPGKIIKKGSFPDMDLALLSIDETSLPLRVRLRLNPLCKTPPNFGASVVVVYPDRTVRSRLISPKSVAPQYRTKFNTLIGEKQVSGSGIFDAERRCLLGIMSAAVRRVDSHGQNADAGYFVPASVIAKFMP
jgi:hypothetical protein